MSQHTTFRSANTSPTNGVDVDGTRFAYREFGPSTGIPVVFLHHFTAVIDDWDPRVIDGIASERRVITFDNRGVGGTEGRTPTTVSDMADDAIAFIRALGLEQVDLMGFSLGGFIAQAIVTKQPALVRRIILAGTGPAGGDGVGKLSSRLLADMMHGLLSRNDPKPYLFFTRTANGKAAATAYMDRLAERSHDRVKHTTPRGVAAQFLAIHRWALKPPWIWARSSIPCSSPTVKTTGCSRRGLRSTLPTGYRTRHSGSTRIPATAACFSGMRSSSHKRSSSSGSDSLKGANEIDGACQCVEFLVGGGTGRIQPDGVHPGVAPHAQAFTDHRFGADQCRAEHHLVGDERTRAVAIVGLPEVADLGGDVPPALTAIGVVVEVDTRRSHSAKAESQFLLAYLDVGRDRIVVAEDRYLGALTDVEVLAGTSGGGQAGVEVCEVRIGAFWNETGSQPAVGLVPGEFQHLGRH